MNTKLAHRNNFSVQYFLAILLIFILETNVKSQTPEEIILKKEIILPELSTTLGNYTNLVRSGNLIYLSGKGPLRSDGKDITGKLGKDMNTDQGYKAARLCGLAHISILKKELGELSKIKRIINPGLTGF